MYIHYGKLWNFLIDKDMTKTDLMELTGISSRVLAKLSKNETVTTDTIARICSALECDVGDIMEYASESDLSIYAVYKKTGVCVTENEFYKTIKFQIAKQKFTVYQSQKTATKATTIYCEKDGTVYWEQACNVGYMRGTPIRTVLIKPPRDSGDVEIVLIKGRPSAIAGLDDNGFISSRGTRKKDSDIFVMSEAAFKVFAFPKKELPE